MEIKNKENSAFPTSDANAHTYEQGLTKREYFAGLALQGFIAGCLTNGNVMDAINEGAEKNNVHQTEQLARNAVRAADALLAELEK